jgi:hypothetical protein
LFVNVETLPEPPPPDVYVAIDDVPTPRHPPPLLPLPDGEAGRIGGRAGPTVEE